MNTEQAVRACEFWTTNVAGTFAYGSTQTPEVAQHFGALTDRDEFQLEQWTRPERRGWAIKVPRWVRLEKEEKVENPAYRMITEEIERRVGA